MVLGALLGGGDPALAAKVQNGCFSGKDVLDPAFFHATYFASPALTGDGSGSGRMRMEKLTEILELIQAKSDIAGFTIAEFLPFEEQRLRQMLAKVHIFTTG